MFSPGAVGGVRAREPGEQIFNPNKFFFAVEIRLADGVLQATPHLGPEFAYVLVFAALCCERYEGSRIIFDALERCVDGLDG